MVFDGTSVLLVDDSFASNQFFLCEQIVHVRHKNKKTKKCQPQLFLFQTYNHTYDFTGEIFSRVRFEFTVRRKSIFYIINLIFPVSWTFKFFEIFEKNLNFY